MKIYMRIKNIVKVTTKEKLDNLNFPEAINFMREIIEKE